MIGQLGELEFGLQFLHQTGLFLFRIELFRSFESIKFILFPVHFRQVQQVFFVPTLGDEEGSIAQTPVDVEGYDDLFGLAFKPASDFLNGSNEQFFIGFIKFSFVFKGKTLVDSAVFDVDVVDECVLFLVVICEGKHV